MADQNLMLGALGLCRKAGKLVMGFDAVAESSSAYGSGHQPPHRPQNQRIL